MRHHLFDMLARLLVVTYCSGVFVVGGHVPVPIWGFDNNAQLTLCSSEVCNETRNTIMENIDSSINACDDFYEHVCGGWMRKNPVNARETSKNQLDVLKIKIMRQFKELISTPEVSDVEAVRKAKKLYDSCIDLDAIEDLGFGPIEDLVFANGGWPLAMRAEDWSSANMSFQNILQNYIKMGAGCPFFSINVVPECFDNCCDYILSLNYKPNPNTPWLHPEKAKQEVIYEAYYNYTEFGAKEMAKSRGIAAFVQIQRDVIDMLKFERSLFDASDKHSSKNMEQLTIRELQELWDEASLIKPHYSINWLEMISSYFDETDIVIDSDQKIRLPSHFLKLLAELLKKTPLRTTVNYIHWFEIHRLLPFVNKKMRDAANKFIQRSKIYEVIEDRTTFCVNHRYQMDHALLYMYAEKYFSKEDQIIVNDMISAIQDEIQQHFMESSWMDLKAKIRAIKKVDNIKKIIGYPDWYNQGGKIDGYYDKLKIGIHFFENVLNVRKFKQVQEFKAFSKPRSQNKHFVNFLDVDGEYNTEENVLDFSAARFQMAFSHPELRIFMMYGGVGSAIAREIIRGIYTEGRKSESGQIIWQKSTISNYIEKSNCLTVQYTNNKRYASRDTSHFGLVIDLTGFTIGVRAYLSYKNQNKPKDSNIPAVNDHTDKQLFFYGLANMFCESQAPGTDMNSVLYNSVRIPGALSNIVEFSEAFNCPNGCRMNPIKKCTL